MVWKTALKEKYTAVTRFTIDMTILVKDPNNVLVKETEAVDVWICSPSMLTGNEYNFCMRAGF